MVRDQSVIFDLPGNFVSGLVHCVNKSLGHLPTQFQSHAWDGIYWFISDRAPDAHLARVAVKPKYSHTKPRSTDRIERDIGHIFHATLIPERHSDGSSVSSRRPGAGQSLQAVTNRAEMAADWWIQLSSRSVDERLECGRRLAVKTCENKGMSIHT